MYVNYTSDNICPIYLPDFGIYCFLNDVDTKFGIVIFLQRKGWKLRVNCNSNIETALLFFSKKITCSGFTLWLTLFEMGCMRPGFVISDIVCQGNIKLLYYHSQSVASASYSSEDQIIGFVCEFEWSSPTITRHQ